jgi:M6 family metalloprotease-like protein
LRGLKVLPITIAVGLLAAAQASAAPSLTVRRWNPNDPKVPAALQQRARENEALLLKRSHLVPHVLSEPGVDWSPFASRRLGWRAPLKAIRDIRTSSTASGPAIAAGPPDTITVAVIRIDFLNDRGGDASSGTGRFNLDPADTVNNPVDRPPHNRTFYRKHLEALSRYYDAMTYGRVVVRGEVWPRDETKAYSVSDMADFGPWTFSQDIEAAAVHMFRTFLFAADSQAHQMNDTIPWNSIDRVMLIHAGSDLQSDVRSDSKEDIPSFTLGVVDTDVVIFPDSSNRYRPVDRASFIPETANQDGFFGALNGVIAHESGHNFFGYVDLYNVDTGFPAVGFWSLMDSGNLAGGLVKTSTGEDIFATGFLPPSVDPFHRFFSSDVLNFTEAPYGAPDSLMDSERHPDMRRVTLSSDEFLVLENRFQTYLYGDTTHLDQDDTTGVILGPKFPDRYEYDALAPGSGILVWHIDDSVITFENSLRPTADFGINTDPNRLGVGVVEADGLADIGDIGSPFIFGSYRDPYYRGNNVVLDDDTAPNLRPHIGTRPHLRITVQDTTQATMRFRTDRFWQLPGWPVSFQQAVFPAGGPQLLAVDADGDGKLEVCWAGADSISPDSTSLFAIRSNGTGIGSSPVFASLDRRPYPVMAALPIGGPNPEQGPALFAATTFADGPLATDAGGQLWLLDHLGFTYGSAWPVSPTGAKLTTPPVFIGSFPNAQIAAGATDGNVYLYNLDGTLWGKSDHALTGSVVGRLAASPSSTGEWMVSAGSATGQVAVYQLATTSPTLGSVTQVQGWPQQVSTRNGFTPDFLWLDMDGAGGAAGDVTGCGAARPELIVHDADRLWGFCAAGRPLTGWGRSFGDTLAPGLGAGDPDGDGLPEVLIQTMNSKVAFVNLTGAPSPGWPKAGSPEGVLHDDTLLTGRHEIHRFPSMSPPLALDLDGHGRPAVVALNTSGIIAALRADGRTPDGWPLATGSGVSGAPLAADLDRDGQLDLVAPDRFGTLYAYTIPVAASAGPANAWTMLGGDPERTCRLPAARTSVAPAPSAGPLVSGSLKAFPNPARRRPISIAYTLTEPSRVEFRVLDTSGHEVASFSRDGRMAENLESWDPGSLPAGLYVVQVRIHGSKTEFNQALPVGVLK